MPTRSFRKDVVSSLDKSLVLVVNPDDNVIEISTGTSYGPPTISMEDYRKISMGRNPSFYRDLTEDDDWYETLKEECRGDRELPNKKKVDVLRKRVEDTIKEK